MEAIGNREKIIGNIQNDSKLSANGYEIEGVGPKAITVGRFKVSSFKHEMNIKLLYYSTSQLLTYAEIEFFYCIFLSYHTDWDYATHFIKIKQTKMWLTAC